MVLFTCRQPNKAVETLFRLFWLGPKLRMNLPSIPSCNGNNISVWRQMWRRVPVPRNQVHRGKKSRMNTGCGPPKNEIFLFFLPFASLVLSLEGDVFIHDRQGPKEEFWWDTGKVVSVKKSFWTSRKSSESLHKQLNR